MTAPIERPLRFVEHAGAPQVWLGSNFWSRGGGPFMWQHYDRDLVRAELATMADHGLPVTRSFMFWPHAVPSPGAFDEDVLERYADFLALHTALGMQTIPTFIVGHMSGENWDPAWRGGRSLYSDVGLVAEQAWYLTEFTRRFADHPALAGWLVSNEMPLYGGAGSRAEVSAWARLMANAIRAGGGDQPLSFGDGAWGVEVTGVDNGFSVRDLATHTDFVGPHVYPMGSDPVRQHLRAAFVCELAAVAGQPVVLEEFGVTSDFSCNEDAADYYRQSLHLSLLAGATGWLAWNNTDFDNLADQDPYRHHPFELHFGLTDVTGQPKPQLQELRSFSDVIRGLDLPHCRRVASEVALLVPGYLDGPAHWTFDETQRTDVHRALEQAYVALREADLPPAFVRETDGLPGDPAVWILPSIKALTAPTWRHLAERIDRGATVFASYATGDSPTQRGPWWTDLETIFGARHRLRYGLVDPVQDEVLDVRFELPFGDIPGGQVLSIPVGGTDNGRVILPVEATDAEVVARDQHGRPVLLRHRRGRGQAVLCTIPLEYFAASRAAANPEPTWRIYRAIATEAGIAGDRWSADPRIMSDSLLHDDGHEFIWYVNASADVVEFRGADEQAHTLPPYGVHVLTLNPTEGASR